MSTPPKLQMSDFSQELIDQLCLAIEEKVEKNLDVIIQKKVEAEVEKQVEKVMKKLREELQPRDVLTEALGALYAFIMRTSSRAHAKQA
ncbi:hypothetical protein CHLRE_01g023913v5 [Chlamydomonas reinhardtii]|uniref:Uncharacterized protein n=1 Tax=Chlamydomonas reinhardtii TaxID=3055 RepID=A0A2K3E6B6_CHLRE|nr:uncharacterized protein CHLRE_01g023913v5 [Chlamydomonas reinhardtii]PNW88314.1 hypothetical protein CHLRE_01g023913v5 [Chlamydomonas reinhardtii]